MNLAIVILAAGQGTRMKSKKQKVLHEVAGKPMICHVYDEAKKLNPLQTIIITSQQIASIKQCLGDNAEYIIQAEQKGTGHAVAQARESLKEFNGYVMVLYGDTPLIESESLKKLVAYHIKTNAVATIATAILPDPAGYGRIIRMNERIAEIVEEKDADDEQKQIPEVNSGMAVFKSNDLFEKLQQINAHNEQGEYYLTDVTSMLVAEKSLVETFELEPHEILGVNSRAELAQASFIMQQKTITKFMDNGVTVVDPLNTYIERDVQIGTDCIIYPQSILKGSTKIGEDCQIGPASQISDSEIGDGSEVQFSLVSKAKVGQGCIVGPYSHLRPGTILEDKAKVGAYSEIKNSRIGPNSKVPHLSYIGDAEIAEDVNVGAGTITCNYNGTKKEKTLISKGAFIGSDTMLVAPVKVGKNAYTGAGSVITDDVPDDALGVERAEQKIIKDYSKKKKK